MSEMRRRNSPGDFRHLDSSDLGEPICSFFNSQNLFFSKATH